MWKCPRCSREFAKKGQQHSCTVYPLENHFKGRMDVARPLFDELKLRIEHDIGPFKVESLPCCIHLVSTYTFAAVYALRDRIRIHFTLGYKLNSSRIDKFSQMSTKRYLYSIDIKSNGEMDRELMNWLKQAYNFKGE
jgi:hypothetical protein